MNVAYKHLQSKLRWRELTIGQWVAVALGGLLAGMWGLYLSPLPPYLSLFSAVYIGGVPVMAVFVAAQVEFDLWRHVLWAISWRRESGVYAPGPGANARGYVVLAPTEAAQPRHPGQALDLEALWD
jgi:hypothetical protein